MAIARLFFRIVETDDGSWACRRGRREVDRHRDRTEALEHIVRIADEHRPSQVFMHHRDGRVSRARTFD